VRRRADLVEVRVVDDDAAAHAAHAGQRDLAGQRRQLEGAQAGVAAAAHVQVAGDRAVGLQPLGVDVGLVLEVRTEQRQRRRRGRQLGHRGHVVGRVGVALVQHGAVAVSMRPRIQAARSGPATSGAAGVPPSSPSSSSSCDRAVSVDILSTAAHTPSRVQPRDAPIENAA
jgi:hypothetical protein